MKRIAGVMLLGIVLIAGVLCRPAPDARAESRGQEHLAYLELTRIRSLCGPELSYRAYRDALARSREYVGLLKGGSQNVLLLREAMGYYEKALTLWSLETDSEFPLDSLRTDESRGADILEQCPAIPRFHYKTRDQIYVRDAVACMWRKAADTLDQAPDELR